MSRSLQPTTKQNEAKEKQKVHVSNPARSRDQPCCLACRQRRIKCDRQQPCFNCNRKGVQCVFPKPKSKLSRDGSKDLLDRLERLEEILHASGDDAKKLSSIKGLNRTNESQDIVNETHANRTLVQDSNSLFNIEQLRSTETIQSQSFEYGMVLNHPSSASETESKWQLDSRGKSNYVDSGLFGESLQEVLDMQDEAGFLNDEFTASASEAVSTATMRSPCSGHEFILGFNSTISSLTDLHPPSSQILGYWALYKQNVDPLIRVLHKPTIEDLFRSASTSPSKTPHSSEPILFAVYLAVTISLEPDECQSILKVNRESAIQRYRFATQQALTRANFLTPKDTNVVAAFVILITCTRSLVTAGEAWMLVGLLIRISYFLELHKDGSQLGLSPYDTEIRRRIWWQVCLLDICISEDYGVDPTIAQGSFDTIMPLNLDDTDLWPEMKELPTEHDGPTEMMFNLARYEIGTAVRDIISMLDYPRAHHISKEAKRPKQTTFKIIEAILENLRLRLERRYFRHCTLDSPLHRITVDVSHVMLAKTQLKIHLPQHHRSPSSEHTEESQNAVFCALVDIIRYARRLETQQRIVQFAWLFKNYSHWSILGLLLARLNNSVADPAKEDAWIVVDEAWTAWNNQRSMPRLIPVLMQQARVQRLKSPDHNKQNSNSDLFRPGAKSSIAALNSNAPDLGSPNTTGLGNSTTASLITSTPSDVTYGSSTVMYNNSNVAVLDPVCENKNSGSLPIPIDISNAWATIANQNSDIPNSMFLLDDIIVEDDLKDGLLID